MSSVFDQDSTTSQPSDDTSSQSDTNDDYIKKVVELKGDQWNDPQALAKGYLNAQTHIQELEEKAKVAEADKNKADYQAEILELLKGKAQATDPNGTELKGSVTEQKADTSVAPVGEEDIKSLVSKALADREATSLAEANQVKADTMMVDAFGTEAHNTMDKRSKELGMSVDRLKDIAQESPEAFMALMGQSQGKETNQSIRGTVNTTGNFTKGHDRTSKYYFELMRKDPKTYGRREVQQQMLEDKKRLGSRFFT